MIYVMYRPDTARTTYVNTKIDCRIRTLHSPLGPTFGWREDGWGGTSSNGGQDAPRSSKAMVYNKLEIAGSYVIAKAIAKGRVGER